MARPPRIPVWLGLDQPVIYFVTLCVENRLRVLDNAEVFTAIEGFCRESTLWDTIAAVVMPDHVHALAAPRDRDSAVTQYSAGLKRYVRRATGATWKWQDVFSIVCCAAKNPRKRNGFTCARIPCVPG